MPRIARKDSISHYYHITVQGINQEYIFERDEDIKNYLKIILNKLKDSNLTILAYCIMNNHAHFLIYTEKSEYLSKYMQKVNTTYSHFYNKSNNRVGYVFKDRYHSQEILDIRHLHNCLRYIHNNPVKAKIVKNMDEYKYSSYNEFLGKRKIINHDSIKLLFNTVENFEEQFKVIHNESNEENEDFIDIKEKHISEFISEIEEIYNKDISEIKHEKNILKKVIKKARSETNATLEELAKILEISKSTVGNYCKK